MDRQVASAMQESERGPRLVLARGHVCKLIANGRVSRYLAQHQPEVLAEFRKIAEMDSAAACADWPGEAGRQTQPSDGEPDP
jgi:hypothetical protein